MPLNNRPRRGEHHRYYPTTDEFPRLELDPRVERPPTFLDVLASIVGGAIFFGSVLISVFGWLIPL